MRKLARTLALGASGLFVVAFVGIVGVAGAAGEPASSASASAAASATPAASGSASAKPPKPPSIRAADIPAERSPLPKAAEWAQAKEVSIGDFATCKVRLLREWMSIRCENLYGASLVAGDPKDVQISAHGQLFEWDSAAQTFTESFISIVLPIERGKARIVTLLDLSGSSGNDYGPAMPGEGPTLQVWWRDGEPEPSIVITR